MVSVSENNCMRYVLFAIASFTLIGCNSAPQPVANTSQPTNVANQSNEVRSVLSHTTENQTPKPANSSGKWSQSGDPLDTSVYDKEIAAAKEKLDAKPSDDGAKKALAQAYFDRGFALTEARQYAAALGDYRRALKFDPDHEDSKKWIEQIVSIYSMLKKSAPKEGEEPPPLPFKKEA